MAFALAFSHLLTSLMSEKDFGWMGEFLKLCIKVYSIDIHKLTGGMLYIAPPILKSGLVNEHCQFFLLMSDSSRKWLNSLISDFLNCTSSFITPAKKMVHISSWSSKSLSVVVVGKFWCNIMPSIQHNIYSFFSVVLKRLFSTYRNSKCGNFSILFNCCSVEICEEKFLAYFWWCWDRLKVCISASTLDFLLNSFLNSSFAHGLLLHWSSSYFCD